jgi:hypothetical protein
MKKIIFFLVAFILTYAVNSNGCKVENKDLNIVTAEDLTKLVETIWDKIPYAHPENIILKKLNYNELVKRRTGVCYERACIIEHELSSLGFKTRRLFILYKDEGNFMAKFFSKGSRSHAMLEVLTEKGWLAVDTNSKYIGVRVGNQFYDSITKTVDMPSYLKDDYYIIVGLIARHGIFDGKFKYIPSINFHDLIFGNI